MGKRRTVEPSEAPKRRRGDKPELILVPGKALNIETIKHLFKHLTGREPSKAQLMRAQALIDKGIEHPKDETGK